MQLDKTFIAIRERDFLEILDLSLHVLRAFFLPLLLALAVGIIPLALVGHLTSSYMATANTGWIGDETPWRTWYTIWLGIWAVATAPLAAVPATLFLGQALFLDKPNPGQIVRHALGSLPQLLLFQVIVRPALLLFFFTSILPFGCWPYLNEILLLERNPLFAGPKRRITTRRRSKSLHGGSFGDLFGRWMLSSLFALGLVTLLMLALWAAKQWVTGTMEIERTTFVLYIQFSLWTAVAYFTVVRFLGYLDLRIRREGWEVELKMRAEAARLSRQLT